MESEMCISCIMQFDLFKIGYEAGVARQSEGPSPHYKSINMPL